MTDRRQDHRSQGEHKAQVQTLKDVQRLHELALDRTPEGRRKLLSSCTALMQKPLNDSEREQIADILVALLDQVDLPERQSLSGQIASNPMAPRRLLVALAHDKLDVARPVLSLSTRLTDADLIYVVEHRSTGHRKIIARRPDVSHGVASALVETNDGEAVASLLYNPQVTLAEALLTRITDMAKDQPTLRRPLVQRSELPPDLALDLYWWVSRELKDHIHRRFEIPDDILDKALERTLADVMKRRPNPEAIDMGELAERLAGIGKLSPGLLIMTLRHYNLTAFTALFMQLSGLSHDAVSALLRPESARNMAIASKASNLDRETFSSILMLTQAARTGESLVNPRELANALEFYQNLRADQARSILAQ